jgi:hypothetical protein
MKIAGFEPVLCGRNAGSFPKFRIAKLEGENLTSTETVCIFESYG